MPHTRKYRASAARADAKKGFNQNVFRYVGKVHELP